MRQAIGILLILLSSFQLNAQKVGLVLSGGGASGMAHIGVLKTLEKNNIPIDYIVGTSVGALIGGLYASGYSPEEIEAIVTTDDFRNSANGVLNPDYTFYLKQSAPNASMIKWNFNLDSIFEANIPTNFVSSTPIDFGLMTLFSQSNAVANQNFDSLLVPFRCLASNISKRKQAILKDGNLASSIRASMTYPFYLAPISLNGDIMFDGGLYNNFPVDVMCAEFNPDYIIASNVSTKTPPPDPDNLISQVKSMLIKDSDYEINCSKGVIVNSNVKDISTFDFYHNQEVIARGIESCEAVMDEIKANVGLQKQAALNNKRQIFNKQKPELVFEDINIKGVHPNQTKYLLQKLKLKSPSFKATKLEEEVMKFASDEKIKSIYPKAEFDTSKNQFELTLDFNKEKSFQASFGGVIASKPFSTGFFELDYNILQSTSLKAHGNIYFGSFYSSVEGGARWDIPFDIPFYLETQFTINQFDYFNSRSTFIEENDPPYIIDSEQYFESSIGLPVLTKGKINLGGSYFWQEFEYYQNDNFDRGDTSDLTKFEGYSTFAKYEFNSLNRKMYASKGSRFQFMFRYLDGKEYTKPGSTAELKQNQRKSHDWVTLQLSFDKYFFRNENFRIGTSIRGVYSDLPFFQNYTATILSAPAYQPLPESKTLFQENYRALSYMGLGLKTIYSIREQVDFRLEAYLFQPYETIGSTALGEAKLGEEIADRNYIGTFTTVYHSRVGPLAASLNYFDGSSPELSFLVHFGYLLYNKRAKE
ncbi:MAG: patatin-like phospholipase family protein [Vicingaceae bacterium]